MDFYFMYKFFFRDFVVDSQYVVILLLEQIGSGYDLNQFDVKKILEKFYLKIFFIIIVDDVKINVVKRGFLIV